AAQPKPETILCPRGNREAHFPVERGKWNLCAEHCFPWRDKYVAIEIFPMCVEDGVGLIRDRKDQIARRLWALLALTRELDLLAGIRLLGNFYFVGFDRPV